MNNMIGRVWIIVSSLILGTAGYADDIGKYSLTVEVDGLRNSKGVVQFALYDKDGSIPDKQYKKYFKIRTGEISNGASSTTFDVLPPGRYAVSILHDENRNGKIDKGLIKPIEGVGFSNYQSVGLTNRPNFSRASFELHSSMTKTVKIIYF